MFRRDSNCSFVQTDNFHARFSAGDYLRNRQLMWYCKSGRFRSYQITTDQYKELQTRQRSRPVSVMKPDGTTKCWWMFRGQFYCEDEGLTVADVKLLILDRLEQERKKVSRAKVRMSAAARLDSTNRRFVPEEVKLHVWQRDLGKCVRCDSQENLEFDHIIPVCKGGSNTARNIQLLCANCNQEKSGNLA